MIVMIIDYPEFDFIKHLYKLQGVVQHGVLLSILTRIRIVIHAADICNMYQRTPTPTSKLGVLSSLLLHYNGYVYRS